MSTEPSPLIRVLGALRDCGWSCDWKHEGEEILYRRGSEQLWLKSGHVPRRVTAARYAFDNKDEKLPRQNLTDEVLKVVTGPKRRAEQ